MLIEWMMYLRPKARMWKGTGRVTRINWCPWIPIKQSDIISCDYNWKFNYCRNMSDDPLDHLKRLRFIECLRFSEDFNLYFLWVLRLDYRTGMLVKTIAMHEWMRRVELDLPFLCRLSQKIACWFLNLFRLPMPSNFGENGLNGMSNFYAVFSTCWLSIADYFLVWSILVVGN